MSILIQLRMYFVGIPFMRIVTVKAFICKSGSFRLFNVFSVKKRDWNCRKNELKEKKRNLEIRQKILAFGKTFFPLTEKNFQNLELR